MARKVEKRGGKQTGSPDSKPAKGEEEEAYAFSGRSFREKKGVYTAGMYHIRGLSQPKAFAVNVELCGEPHKLETDTSATRNVLKEEAYNKLREKVKLKSSKTILSTYTR